MSRFLWNFLGLFLSLFILTFEFDYSILPHFYKGFNPFFESLISFSGEVLFGLENGFPPSISSDSIGLYFHVFNLVVLSILVSGAIHFTNLKKNVNLRLCTSYILIYYISLKLLIYGFDKVFKAQFFLPEPNTLFTPLKDISKDLLYWSTMGVSKSYSMFLGIIEVSTACLLLFKKTRLLGILIGIGVMANVVAVNFSFNISVKVYSLFLLSGFLVLLIPYFRFLVDLFFNQKVGKFPLEKEVLLKLNSSLKKGLKVALILLFFAEALYPFLRTQNFNDDTFPRPKFHGAYQVVNYNSEIKNVFVHRHGYLIFQDQKDEFHDFQLEVDSVNRKLLLFNYRDKKRHEIIYEFDNNSLIHIKGLINNFEFDLTLLKQNLKDVPLLQNEFNWTTE